MIEQQAASCQVVGKDHPMKTQGRIQSEESRTDLTFYYGRLREDTRSHFEQMGSDKNYPGLI